MAEPLGMFSAKAIAATTLTFGLSSATARMVASAAAAPLMSIFIVSMPCESLIDSPPESNVIPLPVIAMGGADARPPA